MDECKPLVEDSGGGGGGVGGGRLSPALLGPGHWVPVQSDYRGAAAVPALRAIEGLEYHVTTVLREGDGEVWRRT